MPTDHTHRKTQTWILVMLFWVLGVSLFVAGYMLYGKQEEQMTTEELAQVCATAVQDAEMHTTNNNDVSCPEPETELEKYNNALGQNLAFSFIDSWNVYTFSSGTTEISLSPDTLGACEACGGYFSYVPVTVTIYQLPATGESDIGMVYMPELVLENLKNDQHISVTTNTAKTAQGGTITTLAWTEDNDDCDAPGCGRYDAYEKIFYVNSKVAVTAEFRDDITRTDDNEGWNVIASSLDFSAFK